MAGPAKLPEGWDFTSTGLEAYEQEKARFDEALLAAWRAKTAARGSIWLDGPDCRDASRYLLTGAPASSWKIALRVVAAGSFVVAGVMITRGFSAPGDLLMLVGGSALAVVVLILQETLLR